MIKKSYQAVKPVRTKPGSMLLLCWAYLTVGGSQRERKTEKITLSVKYKLSEINSTSYPKRTEKNILDSNGTVIFTTGSLTGGSALIRKIANKGYYPDWCVHVR